MSKKGNTVLVNLCSSKETNKINILVGYNPHWIHDTTRASERMSYVKPDRTLCVAKAKPARMRPKNWATDHVGIADAGFKRSYLSASTCMATDQMTQMGLPVPEQREVYTMTMYCMNWFRFTTLIALASLIVLASQHYAFAFSQNPTLSALPGNTAINLGSFTDDPYNGSCGVPISITDYSGITYDPIHHKILAHGGGHSAIGRDDVAEFDFSTLTWSHIPVGTYPGGATALNQMTSGNLDTSKGRFITSNNPVSTHTMDLMPFADSTGEMLVLRGYGPSNCFGGAYSERTVAHYNPSTKVWTYSAVSTGNWASTDDNPSSAYDPISGKILIVSRIGLWIYDPSAKTSVKALAYSNNSMDYITQLVYFPLNQKFYYFTRGGPIRVWEINLNRSNWSSSTISEVTGMTNTPSFSGSSAVGFAVDTVNNVIGGDVASGRIKIFNPMTKAWSVLTMQVQGGGGSIGTIGGGAITYDPVDNVFVFLTNYASGGNTWAYRYAGGTTVPDTTDPSIPGNLTTSVISPTQINLSWSSSTDNVAVTGYRLYRNGVQIATPSSTSYSDSGLSSSTNYSYTVAAVDGAGNTSPQSTAVSATTQPSSGGSSDFATRCAQPGVTICQGWDQASDLNPAVWPDTGIYPNGGNSYANATRDTSILKSGSGSLRFKHPAGAGSPNTTGYWRQLFGQRFSQNSHFYVQYAMRWSPEMASNTASWNSRWKHVIMHQSDGSSCSSVELTVVNSFSGTYPNVLPQMYTDCGARSMYTQLDGHSWTDSTPLLLQQTSQPGVSGYSCQYGALSNGTGSGSGCFNLTQYTNKWVTFYYDILLGSWGQPNSSIKAFISVDGGPYRQWVNVTNMTLYYSSGPSNGYDVMQLTPYQTGLSTSAPVDAYLWFDDLIVSTQPIAAPGGGSGTTNPPPAPPSNLRIN